MTPWIGLRNTAGVILPLIGGVLFGAPLGGLVVASGALNVAFSDGHDPYPQRARRMLASALLGGLAVFAGSVSGLSSVSAVAIAGTWAFAAGLLVSLGSTAGDLGAITLVEVIVFAAQPRAPQHAVVSGVLAVCGGLLQTGLSVLFWPVRRYVPERRALGDLYLTLADVATPVLKPAQAPPATTAISEARDALETLARDHTVVAERYLSLLSQAERIRLRLLALGRLRRRLQREAPEHEMVQVLDASLGAAASLLRSAGQSMTAGEALNAGEALTGYQRIVEDLRRRKWPTGDGAFLSATIRDTRSQMDALAGQLRAVAQLADSANPEGEMELAARQARRPWRLRLGGRLATLRANLNLDSAAFRHAVRLAVCVAVGDALSRGFALPRSYWLPMTVAIVLKPDFTATFSRGVLRLAGTLAGLILATGLFHLLPSALRLEIFLIAVFMFLLRWVGPANYGVFVAAISALVVVLIAFTGVSPKDVIVARGVNTALGGVLALLAYWIWPTWERTQVPESMAAMLDAYREYFRAVTALYLDSREASEQELDRARFAARLARSNAEASVDRFSVEPGATTPHKNMFTSMLASSHDVVSAMMALEAGRSECGAPCAAFRKFANDGDLTLYLVSAVMRGSPAKLLRGLPDLREDHNRLLESATPQNSPHGLINVETDRLTNSLNTLREQAARWAALYGPSYRADGPERPHTT